MAIIFDDSDEPEPVATYHNIFTAAAQPSTTARLPNPWHAGSWVASISVPPNWAPGLKPSPTPRPGSGFYSGDETTLVPGKLRGYRCWMLRWPALGHRYQDPVDVDYRPGMWWPRVLNQPEQEPDGLPVGYRRGSHAFRLTGRVAPEPWEPKPTPAQCHRESLVRRHVWQLGYGESARHPEGQPVPAQECSCGWYAVHSPYDEELSTYGCPCPRCSSTALPVRGVVEAWGRVQLGPRGWRAEHARITALYVPAPTAREWVRFGNDESLSGPLCPLGVQAREEVTQGLEKAYQVPVFSRWEDLIHAYPPIDAANLRVPKESKGTPENE